MAWKFDPQLVDIAWVVEPSQIQTEGVLDLGDQTTSDVSLDTGDRTNDGAVLDQGVRVIDGNI